MTAGSAKIPSSFVARHWRRTSYAMKAPKWQSNDGGGTLGCLGGPGRRTGGDRISGTKETREQPGRGSKVDDGREGNAEGTEIWDEGGALSSTGGF